MATNPESLLRVSDLDLMPDDGNRYELIGGELYVTKSPKIIHQDITGNIIYDFRIYLSNNRIGKILPVQGVVFSEIDGVIPDLIYISNERLKSITENGRVVGAPDLVIEILSPGAENSRRDRVAKRHLYGKFGVREYWIIDPETVSIEVYLLDNGQMRLASTLSKDDILTSSLLPGYSTSVGDLLAV